MDKWKAITISSIWISVGLVGLGGGDAVGGFIIWVAIAAAVATSFVIDG